MYFITGLSKRGKYFPSFLEVPDGYATGIQLVYSQRYINADILSLQIFRSPMVSYVLLRLVQRR